MCIKIFNWLFKLKFFSNYTIDSLFSNGFSMHLLRNCLFDLINNVKRCIVLKISMYRSK